MPLLWMPLLWMPLWVSSNFLTISFCVAVWLFKSAIVKNVKLLSMRRGRRGRDRMVVEFTTTYAISAYHNWWCEFESWSGRGVQHYVIKFVSDLWQVCGFLRFPPPIKLVWRLMQVCLLYMEKPGGRNVIPDAKSESCHFSYNIVKDDTPDYLSGLLPRTVNQANNYNLPNANNFTIPRYRLTLYQNYFFPTTIHLWNNLPQYIRDSPSNCILKSRLNTYYNNAVKLPRYLSFGSRLPSIKPEILRQVLRCCSLGCCVLSFISFHVQHGELAIR
jgi:hypothetical protein